MTQWAVNQNPDQAFYTLANQTGCLASKVSSWTNSISYYFNAEAEKRAENERVLACLRGLSARELVRETPLTMTPVWVSEAGLEDISHPYL